MEDLHHFNYTPQSQFLCITTKVGKNLGQKVFASHKGQFCQRLMFLNTRQEIDLFRSKALEWAINTDKNPIYCTALPIKKSKKRRQSKKATYGLIPTIENYGKGKTMGH